MYWTLSNRCYAGHLTWPHWLALAPLWDSILIYSTGEEREAQLLERYQDWIQISDSGAPTFVFPSQGIPGLGTNSYITPPQSLANQLLGS